MIDPVRTLRRIIHIGREDKALQRCTLSARSMPGDEQEHRLRPVLLPSNPSSGSKATNLLCWGAAPTQAKEQNYPRAVGHMSRLLVLNPPVRDSRCAHCGRQATFTGTSVVHAAKPVGGSEFAMPSPSPNSRNLPSPRAGRASQRGATESLPRARNSASDATFSWAGAG